jgi:hypothetical protein
VVGNIRKYRLIDVDAKEITPSVLAKKYFSSPEVCFIKADETLQDEQRASIRAPINNVIYSQNIQHKITPHACNNILTELYNNPIEVSRSKDIQKYSTAAIAVYKYPVKGEPQEKSASLGSDKIEANQKILSESIRSRRSQLTPAENSFAPIVSVEVFFSSMQSLPLPNHSLEQSPCYPIIGSKPAGNHTMYYCQVHPKTTTINLGSIEQHWKMLDPDHHKTEIISRLHKGGSACQ